MAERRRSADEDSAVAVVESATPASDAYVEKQEELRSEEQRLSVLTGRQASGERLDRDEVLDKLMLESTVVQLRNELDDLRLPMEAEVLTLDIADTVECWNYWTTGQTQAFNQLVEAIRLVHVAKDALVEMHNAQGAAMARMPAFARLGVVVPTGYEGLRNILLRLPESAAWIQALLSPHAGPLTNGQVQAMRDVHVTQKLQDVRHVSRRIERQGRS